MANATPDSGRIDFTGNVVCRGVRILSLLLSSSLWAVFLPNPWRDALLGSIAGMQSLVRPKGTHLGSTDIPEPRFQCTPNPRFHSPSPPSSPFSLET